MGGGGLTCPPRSTPWPPSPSRLCAAGAGGSWCTPTVTSGAPGPAGAVARTPR
ncbi:hypothetical protein SEA_TINCIDUNTSOLUM_81 [Mycobacterium phage Tinciduntsolum]|uniref:Uncharacterized protein n=1 Tax=Mycobacterium phage Tinciduntsolum TaxID=2656609 RepID=A0A649VTI7_9CAUD|nr:hypothetical protein SEA_TINCIDUNTSOLUM_81 [Mycobacterium phage Tinciduntsolum]